nr:MAG TPA: hypothetical protein [Bacteriophage sp.]
MYKPEWVLTSNTSRVSTSQGSTPCTGYNYQFLNS